MPGATENIDWHARARALKPRGEAFINGRRVPARDGATFSSVSPIDGRVLAAVAAGDGPDIDAAVAAARGGFERGDWSRQSPAARKRVLQRFADLVEGARDELALLETLDMGKPITDSLRVDVPATARCLRCADSGRERETVLSGNRPACRHSDRDGSNVQRRRNHSHASGWSSQPPSIDSYSRVCQYRLRHCGLLELRGFTMGTERDNPHSQRHGCQ